MLVSNNDNHRQNCEFAEESIAYLYGEMDESNSAEFNIHLENCSNCADELKSFSSIHSSIQYWKTAKFDILTTPIIEIPIDSRQTVKKNDVLSSWLSNLQERFSLSRCWVQVSAFAVLLICLGFGFYFVSFSNQKEVGFNKPEEKFTNKISSALIDEVAKVDESESNSLKENNSKNPEIKKSPDSSARSQVDKEILPAKETAPLKTSTKLKVSEINRKTTEKISTGENRMPKTNKNILSVKIPNIPKLNALPEETEDEDLRLADLFDEIDAG